jgi:rRNA maturation endonuclease Nob1
MSFEQLKKSHIQRERLLAAVAVAFVVAMLFYVWVVKHYSLGVVALAMGLLIIGAISMFAVRRTNVRTVCEVCNYDLTNVLPTVLKHEVLFCPSCGNKID